jgi:EF-P beta-lysylation protein EpmB
MRDESLSWQKILATGFSTVTELLRFLEIPVASVDSLAAEQQFATRVPRGFAHRMQKGNLTDPLLLQVLASAEELLPVAGFVQDPLQEEKTNIQKGLVHKYSGRVLLTVTGVCAVNCRYCFRRHFPYQENNLGRAGWDGVLQYIADDSSIHEVILSGGDPLLASDSTLQGLIRALENIPHVHTLRIHSRVPVVLPERIQTQLCDMLAHSRLNIVVVLHVNHANELNDDVYEACARLRAVQCHLLNQSVLLKGVNDSDDALVALSERLFVFGILPYYLHLLDKVQGAAHFEVEEPQAKQLFQALQQRLPGYLVPRLVREIAGEKSKTWMNSAVTI